MPFQKGLQIYKNLMPYKIFYQKKSAGCKPTDFVKNLLLILF
jgi:hypothetical protein